MLFLNWFSNILKNFKYQCSSYNSKRKKRKRKTLKPHLLKLPLEPSILTNILNLIQGPFTRCWGVKEAMGQLEQHQWKRERQTKETSLTGQIYLARCLSEPRCSVAIATGTQHLLKGMRKGFMIHIQTTTAWESKYTEVNCHPQIARMTAVRRRGHAENK